MLVLTLALVACGSEPSPTPVAPPTPPPATTAAPPVARGAFLRLPVRVIAWRTTVTGSALLHDAAQTLATGECPIHDSSARDVRLHGRVGENGVLEWMADDAAESVLASCLWDPFLRHARLGPGDFEVRVSLAETPAPMPEATDPPAPIDWSGLTCRHRDDPDCPSGHTCPAYIWSEHPCPSP